MVATTQLQVPHTAQQQVAQAIAWAYVDERVLVDPDYSLQSDPLFWEKLRRDPVMEHAVEQRLLSTAGQDFNVVPGGRFPTELDHGAAVVMEEILDQVEDFSGARKHTAKAIFVGSSWQFVETERRSLLVTDARGKRRRVELLVPSRFEPIDKRQIRRVVEQADPEGPVSVRHEYMDFARKQWVRLPASSMFVHWCRDDEPTRFGYGRGLNDALAFPMFAGTHIVKNMMQLIDRVSQGVWVAKISKEGQAATDVSNEDVRDEHIEALKKHRSDGVYAMDAEDELSVTFPGGEGFEMLIRAKLYYDKVATQAALGAVLPTGGESGEGSRARAEVEAESTDILVRADRQSLDEVYSRDLVAPLFRLNRREFAELGFADARCPRLSCTHERRQDPMAFVQMAEVAMRSGAKIVRSEYYERAGLTQPSDEDEVMEGLPMQDANAAIGAGLPSLPKARDPVGVRSDGGERDAA